MVWSQLVEVLTWGKQQHTTHYYLIFHLSQQRDWTARRKRNVILIRVKFLICSNFFLRFINYMFCQLNHNFTESKVMQSNSLFCPSSSLNPKDIQSYITYGKEKHQTLEADSFQTAGSSGRAFLAFLPEKLLKHLTYHHHSCWIIFCRQNNHYSFSFNDNITDVSE